MINKKIYFTFYKATKVGINRQCKGYLKKETCFFFFWEKKKRVSLDNVVLLFQERDVFWDYMPPWQCYSSPTLFSNPLAFMSFLFFFHLFLFYLPYHFSLIFFTVIKFSRVENQLSIDKDNALCIEGRNIKTRMRYHLWILNSCYVYRSTWPRMQNLKFIFMVLNLIKNNIQ